MKILAVDLGETTGYCILQDYAMVEHGIFPMALLRVLLGEADLVIIERPAYIGAGARIQEEYSEAIGRYRQEYGDKKVKVVRPADWMPRFSHHPLPERGVLKTQHEKDAYRMAQWAHDKFVGA
jgi:hypothetical protein